MSAVRVVKAPYSLHSRVVGKGAYGSVYPSLVDPNQVCKVFKSQLEWLNELSSYRALCHSPYIPQLSSFFCSPGASWICMGRYQTDLSKYKPRSREESIKIGYRLLQAVADIHRTGLVHLDIKPHNILLRIKPAFELVVADLGSALVVGGLNIPKDNPLITRGYRAPEMLLGLGNYSTALDMWSVGVIIYELFHGSSLADFKSNEMVELIDLLCKTGSGSGQLGQIFPDLKKGTFCSGSDPSLADLLRGLLCPDPQYRLSAEQALRHPFWVGCSKLYPELPPRALAHPWKTEVPNLEDVPEPEADAYQEVTTWFEHMADTRGLAARTVQLACQITKLAGYYLSPKLTQDETTRLWGYCLQLASMKCDPEPVCYKTIMLPFKIAALLDYDLARLEQLAWHDTPYVGVEVVPPPLPDDSSVPKSNIIDTKVVCHTNYMVVHVIPRLGTYIAGLEEALSNHQTRQLGIKIGYVWKHVKLPYGTAHPQYLVFRRGD